MKMFLEIMNKLLSIVPGNNYKTIAGAVMVLVSVLAVKFKLPETVVLAYVEWIGEWLFALGLVHWKIKDVLAAK